MAMAEALLGANDFWWGYAVPFSAGLGLVPWLDPIPIPGHQGTHWPCNVSQRSAPGLWNWHFNRPGRRAFSKEGLGTGTGFAAAACCNLLYVLASFVGQLLFQYIGRFSTPWGSSPRPSGEVIFKTRSRPILPLVNHSSPKLLPSQTWLSKVTYVVPNRW